MRYQSGYKDVLIIVLDVITKTNGTLIGGRAEQEDVLIDKILTLINKNGIERDLSILGGEPLCDQNVEFTTHLLAAAKQKYPNITTYVWSGSTLEELKKLYKEEVLFRDIDVLIDGPFEIDKRDISLPLRGSSNQRILRKSVDFLKK